MIGGTITGLTRDKQIILRNNGNDELRVMQNGSFVFSKTVDSGSDYSVTVKAQPDRLNCAIDAGSGKPTADVDNIKVKCTTTPETEIVQLTGKWYTRDYCHGFALPGFSAQDTLNINMSRDLPKISYGLRVYESSDCKGKFVVSGTDTFSTEKVRSSFVYEDISVFRLSLLSEAGSKKLQAFLVPLQQNIICLINDDMEKTDEALVKYIKGISYPSQFCYFRLE